MTSQDIYEIELNWQFMRPVEQAVWGTLLALHLHDDDGGLGAADAGLLRLRSLSVTRARRPEPEEEAAHLNIHMDFEEFVGWYPIAYKMMHKREKGLSGTEPTTDRGCIRNVRA